MWNKFIKFRKNPDYLFNELDEWFLNQEDEQNKIKDKKFKVES
jgi:hypothetical protein